MQMTAFRHRRPREFSLGRGGLTKKEEAEEEGGGGEGGDKLQGLSDGRGVGRK